MYVNNTDFQVSLVFSFCKKPLIFWHDLSILCIWTRHFKYIKIVLILQIQKFWHLCISNFFYCTFNCDTLFYWSKFKHFIIWYQTLFIQKLYLEIILYFLSLYILVWYKFYNNLTCYIFKYYNVLICNILNSLLFTLQYILNVIILCYDFNNIQYSNHRKFVIIYNVRI